MWWFPDCAKSETMVPCEAIIGFSVTENVAALENALQLHAEGSCLGQRRDHLPE